MQTWEEYRACEDLQREVWGEGFGQLVPASILEISTRLGGVVSGAFADDGEMAGFVFGLTGVQGDARVHWSHMLAVREGLRGSGLGPALKRHQRDLLLRLDVTCCYWTYDPLVSRNAHINLNRFLARVDRYVEDMYGETGSALHRGLGTDRFVVRWDLRPGSPDPFDPRDPARGELEARLERHASAPVADPGGREDAPLPGGDAVRVAIPADIHAVRAADPERARAWRSATRRAFQRYLSEGWCVLGYLPPEPRAAGPLRPDDVGHYVLVRS